ncbi:P1 family peptidase [Primorskyibacter sp. S87]|uniref:P1 family peptidase n=1 Tax=Primorskyibacter sp. S87 TaxID=3415126 RepID=UPI003C7E08DB
MKPGSRNLITDVPGILVGNAQDDTLKSGTTILTAEAPFTASVSVMGGAPGTRETDLLAPDKSVAKVDAITLSGGSAFGLDACSGVMSRLREQGRGFKVGNAVIPIVPGAIIFDLINGGEKNWAESPYPALGRAAAENAGREFELGSVGAGTGALTAMHKGGLGSASLVLEDGTTVGALVAANPMGSVTTPGERHFWAAPFEIDDEFGGIGADPSSGLGRSLNSRKVQHMAAQAQGPHPPMDRANTTIAIVATDADLSKSQCLRLATAAQDGIARAIVPAHSPADGDLVFSVSTNTKQMIAPERDLTMIGHAAALCLSRAIARAIYSARPAPNDVLPCWSDQMK